jgi:hypothetical protein
MINLPAAYYQIPLENIREIVNALEHIASNAQDRQVILQDCEFIQMSLEGVIRNGAIEG